MARRRVVLCGLARNVAHVLPHTIERIERLGDMFADYRVVIYENDSHDETLELLHSWQGESNRVDILSECRNDPVNLPVRCLDRTARMARYRNMCRDYIASRYADFDFAIVVDTDLYGGWSYDGVAHTFGQSSWDSVGSYGIVYRRNGLGRSKAIQYDAWALRRSGSDTPLSGKEASRLRCRRGDSMLRVNSCFGGLGVYRMEALLACGYDGSDCEHVGFHRQMREQGLDRIYLNPNQIVLYGRKRRSVDRFATACHQTVTMLSGVVLS